MMLAQSNLDGVAPVLQRVVNTPWDYGRSVLIILVAVVVARALRFGVDRGAAHRGSNAMLADLLGRLLAYVIVAFGVIYALETLGVAIGPVLGALGIAGVALAFALQDMVENFVAGVTLQVTRPFDVGDEVTAADYLGRVTQVGARSVSLETPGGDTVVLPSVEVVKNPMTNHTRIGRRRSDIQVGVAYGSDLALAGRVILEAIMSVADVFDDPAPTVRLVSFGDSSIDFKVLVWHRPEVIHELTVVHEVILAIDTALREANITIPFPQRVVTMNPQPSFPVDPVVGDDTV